MRNHYQVLGVEEAADEQAITRAFRRLARENHPDTHPNDPAAEERFKEISAAYETLSDPTRRAAYDAERHAHQGARAYYHDPDVHWSQDSWSGGVSWEDLFAHMRATPRPGQEVETEIHVSFAESLHGTTRSLTLALPVPCPDCQGQRQDTQCLACGGRGTRMEERRLRVTIPAGARDGLRIRLPGRGLPGIHGGLAGDVQVRVHVDPHPHFQRRGDDILLEHHIRFDQAALGDTIDVPTPWETSARMRIPPGTQSGHTLRLQHQGAPRLQGSGRGALLVTLRVDVPCTLSNAQRAALEDLRAASC